MYENENKLKENMEEVEKYPGFHVKATLVKS